MHSVAELNVRETVLECLMEIITMDSGSEYQILIDAIPKCEGLQNAILDVIASDMPVFEINQY